MQTSALYFCPKDGSPLNPSIVSAGSAALTCRCCTSLFDVTDEGIALLDVVQLPEAKAFDEQHENYLAMSAGEIEASKSLAGRYFALIDQARLPAQARVLDVACGKGELTVGLSLLEPLRHGTIYAFDHSLESLRALARTLSGLQGAAGVRISTQDATKLAFPDGYFDLVVGNAVLHHFLDWEQFIESVHGLLRPGGQAVFSEPFLEGYGLAMVVFRLAARVLNLSGEELSAPDMGLYNFIVENIGGRIRNLDNPDYLEKLTDKHFFSMQRLLELGEKLGFQVTFDNYEPPSYYDSFISDLLDSYRISRPDFRSTVEDLYRNTYNYFGPEFSRSFAHFRFITLAKPPVPLV